MRWPTAKSWASALIALAVLVIVIGAPRTLQEMTALPRIETFISAACGGTSQCPQPDRLRWLHALETLLAERMPQMAESDRSRLADVIYEEARAGSLDPLFVLAVIAVESGFDHVAESERGAKGLMQLRPSTLRTEAERSQLSAEDLDDPVTNVRAGIRYFRRLVRAFGSTDLALMAYNAGPNRILRYLDEDGEVPERFQVYPEKIRKELGKLKRRQARAARTAPADPAAGARAPAVGPVAAAGAPAPR